MTWLTALGWLGNALYFGRFLIQWLASERAGKTMAPKSFWWLSLGGAVCLGAYSFLDGDNPLFVGYALTFALYLRNIMIAHMGRHAGSIPMLPAIVIGLALSGILIRYAIPESDAEIPELWIAIGFIGQAFFSSRFVVQWFVSERQRRAHFPPIFWWLSLIGNILLLAYVIRKGDWVFIAGFSLGPFVQIRNLMLSDHGGTLDGVSAGAEERATPGVSEPR